MTHFKARRACTSPAKPKTSFRRLDLIRHDPAPGFLFGGVVGFVGKEPLFGAAAAAPLLAADLLDAGLLRRHPARPPSLNLIKQQPSRQKAIEPLLAGDLTLDMQTRRTMQQDDAGGRLVNVLATVPARPDKGLFNVRLAHAQRCHALGELSFFVGTDGNRVHEREDRVRPPEWQ